LPTIPGAHLLWQCWMHNQSVLSNTIECRRVYSLSSIARILLRTFEERLRFSADLPTISVQILRVEQCLMLNELSADLIEKIRKYQRQHPELLEKSHHFVFDCPLNFSLSCRPRYIWIGLNPGNDESDWSKTKGNNDEETRDRDFQEIYGRSRGSKTRKTKIRNFLGQTVFDQTTHTEIFFWGSKNLQDDFYRRYGTSLHSSPHLEFCTQVNRELVDRVKPKAIFFESLDSIKVLEKAFALKKVDSYPAGTRKVDEYLVDGKYRLLNFDHLSSGPPASLERAKVAEIVRMLVE